MSVYIYQVIVIIHYIPEAHLKLLDLRFVQVN